MSLLCFLFFVGAPGWGKEDEPGARARRVGALVSRGRIRSSELQRDARTLCLLYLSFKILRREVSLLLVYICSKTRKESPPVLARRWVQDERLGSTQEPEPEPNGESLFIHDRYILRGGNAPRPNPGSAAP